VPLPADFVEAVKQAIVIVLDTNSAIVALAGRANGTVIPYDDLGDPVIPGIEYMVVVTTMIGGIGDTRRVLVSFTANAELETDANALLNAVEKNLTCPALIAAGLDAYPVEFSRTGVAGRASDGTSSASMDVTLIVTK
jgi:hypothetical protein